MNRDNKPIFDGNDLLMDLPLPPSVNITEFQKNPASDEITPFRNHKKKPWHKR